MNLKIKRLIRWLWHRCFGCFCILLVFCTLVITAFTYFSEETRDIYFVYHEETYQELEAKAHDIVKAWDTIEEKPYIESYQTVLRSEHPRARVTLNVSGYGTDSQQVTTTRGYTSHAEQVGLNIFSFVILSAIATAAFLAAIFVLLILLGFISWLIPTIRKLWYQGRRLK